MELRTTVAVGSVALLAVVLAASPPVAAQEERPRAEAGLDQHVSRNASVLLDASESWSPNGELTAYEWTIEAPNGTTVDPSCDVASCRLAQFPASELGTYTVTLDVEDETGATMSDTMYVEAVPQGAFGVDLSGPDGASPGSTGTLTATVSAGDATLQGMTWYRGDSELGARNLSGFGGAYDREVQVIPGATYRVAVQATYNRTVTDTWTAPSSGTWTPSSSQGYPRIEGPTLVTGRPDDPSGDAWGFEDITYELVSGPLEFSDRGVWSAAGPGFSDNHNGHGWTKEFALGPGVTVLTADVDFDTRIDGLRGAEPEDGTEHRDIIVNTSPSTTVSQAVVVDPAPQILDFEAWETRQEVGISFTAEDRYNPSTNFEVLVGGDTVHTEDIRPSESFSDVLYVDPPENTHGTVSVEVQATDGRGQSASATGSVSLPVPLAEIPPNQPSAVLSSSEFNSGGTAPVFP